MNSNLTRALDGIVSKVKQALPSTKRKQQTERAADVLMMDGDVEQRESASEGRGQPLRPQPSPQPAPAPAPAPEPEPVSAKKKMAMTVAYSPGDDLPAAPKPVVVGDQATADTFLDAPLPVAPAPAVSAQSVDAEREADRDETELASRIQALGTDRSRLADELDNSLVKTRKLERTNREIAEKLDTAISTIRAVLDVGEGGSK